MAFHLNLMTAQAQGRVQLVFFLSNGNGNGDGDGDGDGVSFGLELPKLPFHYNYNLTSIRRKRRRRRRRSSSLEQVEESPNSLLPRRRSSFSFCSSWRIHSSLSNTNNKKHTTHFSSDDDDDDDDNDDDLSCFRGLVLDISYRPINVVCWKRAICLEFMEKADVLEYYAQTVNSATGSFYIPAVLRVPHLLQVVKRRRINTNLSRKNILYRDAYSCQYCSSRDNLTIDHVIPAARGGEWKWENLVTACAKCNSKKGQKTLEEASMKLSKAPKAPKDYDILTIPLTTAAIKMLKMRQGTPEEWRQYLS